MNIPFRPRLFDALKNYSPKDLAPDLIAGVTVGIVALPLAMAFAIASGVKPEAGIFTAVIAGFIISALGGTKVSIGGPTGAFIVILYGIGAKYGFDNLIICTIMAGGLLLTMGVARMGTMIKFIPYPVTMGFTSGIAVLIFSTQIKDFFGLQIDKVPSEFVEKMKRAHRALRHLAMAGAALAAASLAIILFWPASGSGAFRVPSWRWSWARWPSACSTSRWRPSAASSAAFRRACRTPIFPCSPGTTSSTSSSRP